jgi:hypothetical protein
MKSRPQRKLQPLRGGAVGDHQAHNTKAFGSLEEHQDRRIQASLPENKRPRGRFLP